MKRLRDILGWFFLITPVVWVVRLVRRVFGKKLPDGNTQNRCSAK